MTEIEDRPKIPPPSARKLLEPGTVLAQRYRIISVVGQGGMGVVYKVQHIHMERDMAVKTLATEMSPNAEPFRRFQQEAKVIAALHHPNIVDIHDFAVEGNKAYLVMDFLDGIHIENAIDQFGPMSLDHFIHIFSQACEALHHAHSKGIIHRDLKGGNMMIVTEDERHDVLKLVDFGISKLLEDDVEEDFIMTKASAIVGSPLFMSPEQCLGRDFDHRADIYSLGVVMYRSLTGELPIVGETAMKTIEKHVTELPPFFSEVNPDVSIPESLENVIRKALAKHPDERQQSMLELLQELKEAVKTSDLAITSTDINQEQVLEPAAVAPVLPSDVLEPVSDLPPDAWQPPIPVGEAGIASEELDDWKKDTSVPSFPEPTLVPSQSPVSAIPTPHPALPHSALPHPVLPPPTLPPPTKLQQAATSSSSFAQRWNSSARSAPNQGSNVGQSPIQASPRPQSKAAAALFKLGQFDPPPQGLPPLLQSQPHAFRQTSSSTSQAKAPGQQQQQRQQLDQLIRRSAPQARVEIEGRAGGTSPSDKQSVSSQPAQPDTRNSAKSGPSNLPPSAASVQELNQIQAPSSGQSFSKPGNERSAPPSSGTAGDAGKKTSSNFSSSRKSNKPVVDEFFFGKVIDKVMSHFRKLFPAPKAESHVQETHPEQLRMPEISMGVVLICVITIAVCGFLAYQFCPRTVTADQAFGRISHRYESADRNVQFRIMDVNSCELMVQKKRAAADCRFFLNDWRDALHLSLGLPFQNQYWVYETPYGLVDDNNNYLYGAFSPESLLTEKIVPVGKYAAMCYAKTAHYPDTATRVKSDIDLDYKNPFTQESEMPSFQGLTIGSGKDEASDDKERREFYSDLSVGGTWKNAPAPHAGQIRCCAVQFKNGRGDTQAFVAQIIGGNDKPIREFSSGTNYFYALENGKAYKGSPESESPQFPFTGKTGQPDVIWYFTSKPDSSLVSLLNNGATIIFSVLAVISLLFGVSLRSVMQNKWRS